MTDETKKRARKSAAKTTASSSLINALKFISVAQASQGSINQQHCIMFEHFIYANDGILIACHPIEEDLNACPHSSRLTDALKKCGPNLSITQLDNERLAVKSDKFRAVIPCVNQNDVVMYPADDNIAVITDEIKIGFGNLVSIISENALRPFSGAILLQSGSMVATNGHVILEYWHGLDLPPGILIPKVAAKAVAECKKPLTGFGFSSTSATFYFEDGSFIKTQLFVDKYPAYLSVFEGFDNPFPLPLNFFEALDKVASFSENDIVYFYDSEMRSSDDKTKGASYEIEGLPDNMGFNANYLNMVRVALDNVQFSPEQRKMWFTSGNMRGCLMGYGVR